MDASFDSLKSSSRFRRWRRRLIGLLAVLVLLFIAVQVVLWSDYPKTLIVRELESTLGLRVSIGDMTTGWTGRTRLTHVILSLPLSDEPLVQVGEIRARHAWLPSILMGRALNLRALELDDVVLEVHQEPSGRWNLQVAAQAMGLDRPSPTEGSGRPALPDLAIRRGIVRVSDNQQRQATIEPVTFSGRRSGTLRYDLDLWIGPENSPTTRVAGALSLGSGLGHQLSIEVRELAAYLAPWIDNWPDDAWAKGRWAGEFRQDRLAGRLELQPLFVQRTWVRGTVDVQADASQITLRPRDLHITPPQELSGALEHARVVAGAVHVDPEALHVHAQELRAQVGREEKGLVQLSGAYRWSSGAAELDVLWYDLEWSMVSTNGRIEATLTKPLLQQLELSGRLWGHALTPAGQWQTQLRFDALGPCLDELDFKLQADHVGWTLNDQTMAVQNATARLTTRGRHIHLHNMDVSGRSVDAQGAINLSDYTWWLYAFGRDLPLAGGGPARASLLINSWGDSTRFMLQNFYLRLADVELSGYGGVIPAAQTPVDLHLYLTELPQLGGAEKDLIHGYLKGKAHLSGGGRPLLLDIQGKLEARDLVLGEHRLGDIDILLTGQATDTWAELESQRLELLGGQWNLNGRWQRARRAGQLDEFRITAEFEQLPVEQLGSVMDIRGLFGTADGRFVLDMPGLLPSQTIITGQVSANNVGIGAYVADQATAQLRVEDRVLRIDPLLAWRGDGNLRFGLELPLHETRVMTVLGDLESWPVVVEHTDARAVVSARIDTLFDLKQLLASGRFDVSADLSIGQRPVGKATMDVEMIGPVILLHQMQAESLGGSFQGSGRLSLQRPLDTIFNVEWADVQAEHLAAWFPNLKPLQGTFSGTASLRRSSDPRSRGPLQWHVAITTQDAAWGQMSIADSRIDGFAGDDLASTETTLSWEQIIRRAGIERMNLALADGTIGGFVRFSRRPDDSHSVLAEIDYAQLNLEQLVKTFDPTRRHIPGRLEGRLRLFGIKRYDTVEWMDFDTNLRRILASLQGDLSLQLRQADLVEVPAVALLYNLMRIGTAGSEPRGEGEMRLRLENDTLTLVQGNYFNRGAYVRATGTINELSRLPISPLEAQIVGTIRPLRELRLPFMADIDQVLSVLQANATSVRVTGTLQKPEVRQATFDELGETMRRILIGEMTER